MKKLQASAASPAVRKFKADEDSSHYDKNIAFDEAIGEALELMDARGLGLGQKSSRLREIFEKVWTAAQDSGFDQGVAQAQDAASGAL